VCDAVAFERTDVVKTPLVVHAFCQRFDIEVKGYTILVEILQSKVTHGVTAISDLRLLK